jgi:hypothetical protein
MAACMEYKLIFNETPMGLTYVPKEVSEEEAIKMQNYAEEAFEAYQSDYLIE